MKIYIFKLKNMVIYVSLVILCTIIFSLIGVTSMKALGVAAASGRDLPIYCVETKEKIASITFDCAWGADDIPSILDTLEKENIKATFFLVGLWAEKFPETVKLISEKGHDIANHSYSHLRMGVIDNQRIRDEIIKCNQTLEKLTGKKVDLFRAPYGEYNNSVVGGARKEGCYTIQWDVEDNHIKVKRFYRLTGGFFILIIKDRFNISKCIYEYRYIKCILEKFPYKMSENRGKFRF